MLEDHYDIIIIGAGPAALMAAIESNGPSVKTLVLEKMHKPAMKLRLSGKGRCNITNDADLTEFLRHFGKNGRFLKFAFAEFFRGDLLDYFEKLGVRFKLERGGRYFPQSNNAMEIVDVLLERVKLHDIHISTNSEATGIAKLPDNKFSVTINKNNRKIKIKTDKVLLATGGKSYPGTGSSGAGFKLASKLGHTVTLLSPALVPLETRGSTAKKLQGLSLKNVNVTVWSGINVGAGPRACPDPAMKKEDELFGEMLFTHSGVSGPVILSLSRTVVNLINKNMKVSISLDLKPALEHKMLEQRLLKEINEHSKQNIKRLLRRLLPGKLVPVFIEKLKIQETKQLNQISSEERKKLRILLKEFTLEVKGCGSFNSAIVTSGGISIKEINPQTMESRVVKGLYFAGEIIDIDADTGGFNLQAAFSTGWIAGMSMKEVSKRESQ
ncbi:MAG: NAD(P)/FAD-dependent oxidoreductase [Nitrospirota bacterium]